MSTFRAVFIAVVIGAALLLAAFLINAGRPDVETAQPAAAFVRASGKCATCHREESHAVVVEFERSEHAAVGVTCLDCHTPLEGQEALDHRGFTITTDVSAGNCAQCHATQYREFLRSRHAAPAYAAVTGPAPFTAEQVAFAEQYHEGAVDRPPNALALLEGEAAITSGCVSCHQIGAPNDDGSIGNCTACHARHQASLEVARSPETCGQCHMGPDHSQFEIYSESKHGILFNAMRPELDMGVDPEEMTAEHMSVPTCATCHMSGLGTLGATHDVGERLSYYLFAEVSEQRPTYLQGREEMMVVCGQCHTQNHTLEFFEKAEAVLEATNDKVLQARAIMDELREAGALTPEPFDEPIEFTYFDYWHYFGRTAKHGAFMGGADFVQWHGNYELLHELVQMRAEAEELLGGRVGTAPAEPVSLGTPGTE